MKRLENWLKDEAFGKEIAKYMGIFLAAKLVYSIIAACIISIFVKMPCEPSILDGLPIWLLIPCVFLFAATEEMIFRAPIGLVAEFEPPVWLLLIISGISSVIFRWLHGGPQYIFIQGAGGFGYCILFLKCGGADGQTMKPVAITTTVHALFNLTVIMLSAVL